MFFETPLHYAAKNGHISVVKYLVNNKADINPKNHSIEPICLIRLLFTMLLNMAILVLLNILLIIKQIQMQKI